MLPDLEHLISLQKLENSAADAREKLNGVPARLDALEARLTTRAEDVATAMQQLEEHRASRATIEKELAEVQTRMNRFKDQLMAVKTNKEYHAMQKEIATADQEITRLEDGLLERMLEEDELGSVVKQTEQQLKDETEAVDKERTALEKERNGLEQQLSGLDSERAKLTERLSSPTQSLFETVARNRNGVAVVEAKQGHCTSCQVRLRPQLFNDVRSNTALIQCESCQRILFFAEHRHVAS